MLASDSSMYLESPIPNLGNPDSVKMQHALSQVAYFPAVCVGQGMIGTALMLFFGDPSTSLSL